MLSANALRRQAMIFKAHQVAGVKLSESSANARYGIGRNRRCNHANLYFL